MSRHQTKEGKHGTLYRFVFEYADSQFEPEFFSEWGTWAYNEEHAWEKWHDSNEELGFHATGKVRRAVERA